MHHHYVLYAFAAAGAFLTSFYMFRLTYVTFYGQSRVDPEVEHHIHESPPVMTVPLMILAGLSVLGGFLGVPPEHGWFHGFLESVASPVGAVAHEVGMGTLIGLMAGAIGIALGGWGLAHYLYAIKPGTADAWSERFAGAYRTLLNKYYVDELYDALFVEPCKRLGRLWDWIDQHVIDRVIRGIGRGADVSAAGATWAEKHIIYGGLNVIGYANHLAAWSWRKLQTGLVNHYAAVIVIGLFILTHFLLVWLTGTSLL